LKISVVIPTKNEEKTLHEVLEGVGNYADEILVVDGHSTDRTKEIALQHNARFVLDHGKGKGDGLRTAIAEVTGDIIVFIDADGSHDPHDIPRLVAPIVQGKADHVGGSRMLGGSEELSGKFEYLVRWLGSAIILIGINYWLGVFLTDSQNGFRAIKTDVARRLGLRENITTIEQEMVIKTIKKGFIITEVPTHEYIRKHGESKIRLSRVWFRYVYSWLKYLLFA
jgi:dolichol-phosphate hexosyltransferase